jgi:drug/metabolite transporter (DMT)-like permease
MKTLLHKRWGITLIALVYSALWGFAYPTVKMTMESFAVVSDLDKCLIAGLRFSLSGAALCIVAALTERPLLPTKKETPTVLLYGLLGTSLQYAFTFIGLSRVSGATGALFDQLCVFLVVLFGGLFLKGNRLTLRKIVGCVVGAIGVLAASALPTGFGFTLLGEGAMTLAALCQAGAYLVAARYADNVHPIRLVGNGQLLGGVLLILITLPLGAEIPAWSPRALLLLLTIAAISALAYVLSLLPLRHFPASEVAVYNLLIPIFGVVASGILLGEDVLELRYLISVLLISFGIYVVNTGGIRRGDHL